MLSHLSSNLDIFMCPACRGDLKLVHDVIKCTQCHHHYQVEDGIPQFFIPNECDGTKIDVSEVVKEFYEKTPFPNYEEFENVESLKQKAQKSIFPRLLDEQVPFNIRVLEVGCGTGQLSNFLGIAHRTVFGTDMCLNSLELGRQFKKQNGLKRVGFYQMNLFRPVFREESFSFVICNGVLHHTSDPFLGFQCISKLVKKGGFIIIGLYNKYGRITTDMRRIIFKIFNDRFKFLDPRLRQKGVGDLKKLTWFMDQYKNPHESKHTIGEVLKWFDQTGFDFVNSLPKPYAFEAISENEKLFKLHPRGNWLDHFLVQMQLMFSGSREGGFFQMIGRKAL
jgi:SAM-dependent methyltransferase